MKTIKILKSFLLCGTAALFTAAQLAAAQTPPNLALRLFAGVNVSGATGSVYAVQSMRGGAYDYPNSSCRSASRLFRPPNQLN